MALALTMLGVACAHLPAGAGATDNTGTAAGVRVSRISYLAGASAYVESGSADGLAEGDTLRVVRDGQIVAMLRARYVSDHHASCDTLVTFAALAVGDRVEHAIHAVPAGGAAGAAAAAPTAAAAAAAPNAAEPSAPRTPPWLRGRIGLHDLLVDASDGSSHLHEPMVDLRLDGTGVGGFPVDLALDLRSRRTMLSGSSVPIATVENDTRVYRGLLSTHDRAARYRLTLGRQGSPSLASVNLFDGALVEITRQRWGAGVFGGTQPAPSNLGFSSHVLEQGAYAEWRARPQQPARWSMTAGGIMSTVSGEPNRDFVFVQGFRQDRRSYLSLAQEIDINRGWRRAPGDALLSPTSTFATARVDVARGVAVRAGFDNRRSVRLYSDRLTPEQEFDDRYREGGWGGMSVDVAAHVRIDTDIRLRTGAPSDRSTAWSASAEFYRLTSLRARLVSRVSRYTSDATDSELFSLGLGLDPGAGTHLELGGGTRSTADHVVAGTEHMTWWSAATDVALAQRWFVNGSIELDRSDLGTLRQVFAGLSWRF